MLIFDLDAFYVALDRRRRHHRMSWRDVADATGVSPATLSRLAQGGGMNVHTMARLLSWTGSTDVYPFITTGQE